MRIGVVHNFYKWRGGEDAVFEAECALLARYGFDVFTYTVHNDSIASPAAKVRALFGSVWNWQHYRGVRRFIREQQIDVLHVHNFFPLVSPSVFWAAAHEGVPVAFTVHNYRLGCLNAQFLRQNSVCLACAGKSFKYAGVMRGCYHGSRVGSLAIALMLALHRAIGTWRTKVGTYIALTEFGRQKIEQEGVPPDRIAVKSNFVFPQPRLSDGWADHFLFLGRHSDEKGIGILLRAWQAVDQPCRLVILGDGPLTAGLKELAGSDPRIEFRGRVSAEERDALRRSARAVIFPSLWFEGFPMVIAESLAAGVPVVSSRLGAMQAILKDGVDSLLFEPGNAEELAGKINALCADPMLLNHLRDGARKTAAASFRAEQNLELLQTIYTRLKEGQPIHA